MKFKILKSKKMPDFKKITSIAIIAFDEDYRIAVVDIVKRGLDIPGGHVEKNEKTIFETVRREFKEEFCGELHDNLKISSIIRSYYSKTPSYMVILNGRIKNLSKYIRFQNETKGRKVMDVGSFVKAYKGDMSFMREILINALLTEKKTIDKLLSDLY